MTENRDSPQWLLLGGTLFSLVAFAANSIFCRLALKSAAIDPESFTAIRLIGGALFLAGICVGAVNIWLTVRGARGSASDLPLAPQAAE